MSTYPDQNFKGVDSIIYSPLNIIHQVVSGASDHHSWDGTILFICLKVSTPTNTLTQKGLKLRFTSLKNGVIYHVWRPPPECLPPQSDIHHHSDPSHPESGPSKDDKNVFIVKNGWLFWMPDLIKTSVHSPSWAELQLPQSCIISWGPTWS